MASFRDIDERLLALVDPETGEVEDLEEFERLAMEKDAKLEGMGLWIKDLEDEEEALGREMDRLTVRRRTTQNKIRSLKKYLLVLLNGEKFITPRVVVSFRRTKAVEIDNEGQLIEWAQRSTEHGDTVLHYRDPEISKSGVRQLIEEGVDVPGAQIVTRTSTIIK